MAHSEIFLHVTGRSISDTRMDAQEIVLRFLGFHFYMENYYGEMNSFLDFVSEKLNELDSSELKNAELLFYKSLECADHLFGRYAFRKCMPEHLKPGVRRQFINKAMFVV